MNIVLGKVKPDLTKYEHLAMLPSDKRGVKLTRQT